MSIKWLSANKSPASSYILLGVVSAYVWYCCIALSLVRQSGGVSCLVLSCLVCPCCEHCVLVISTQSCCEGNGRNEFAVFKSYFHLTRMLLCVPEIKV